MTKTVRDLAALVEAALPKQVQHRVDGLPAWPSLGAMLMARIVGQARAVATLLDERHEVDSRIVVRSLLEHVTALGWLAITPESKGRKWRAQDPPANVRTWLADDARRERELARARQGAFGGELLTDADLGRYTSLLAALPEDGLPSMLEMTKEVDAHWGGRLAGFSDAKRRSPHFAATFQGLYWALYNSGSQAAHPKIGTLWECFATELAYFDGKKARIHPERATADRIDFAAEVVAYLVGYAVVISHHAFGWPDIDAALRLAGRYEDVRSPELLAAEIDAIVGDKNGRRWALTGTPLSVERHDRHLAAVVPVPGGYMRLDRLADRAWKLTARAPNTSGKDLRDSPQASLESAIRSVRSLIAQVGDVGWTDAEPSAWPDDAP